jgi:formylglycine-generating enzyme required for sulfatase activity
VRPDRRTIRRRLALAACALLLAAGCSPSAPPAPPSSAAAPSSAAPAPQVASPKEILTDLKKWDAATTSERRAAAEDVARRLPAFALLRLETFSCGGQTHEVAIYADARIGMEFVLVPSGTFVMGMPEEDDDIQPRAVQHSVTLTRPCLIARTACTQAAYEKIVGTNPSRSKGPTLPVETVSWDDATAFCGKAGLELPTEAQWEFACRAGTTTKWCCGDDEQQLLDYAWIFRNSGASLLPPTEKCEKEMAEGPWKCAMHPVAEKKPNAFGLFDVHGNVWQWCADWYGDYPHGSATDPSGGTPDRGRVNRGGGWGSPARSASSATRRFNHPHMVDAGLGFRPAKTVPAE